MTQADPLNTTPWKPVDLDWGDGETVRVIDDNGIDDPHPSPGGRTTRDEGVEPGRTRSRSAISEPARLIPRPSADDHHALAVQHLVEACRYAIDSLDLPKTGAKAWARSLGYDTKSPVVRALDEAVGAIHEVLNLVDAAENG